MKEEKMFRGLFSSIEIGQPAILVDIYNRLIKTSLVENYHVAYNGNITIVTKNSIYRNY